MAKRDDFNLTTKRMVALRAGYHCSLPECNCLTAGPSEESASHATVIGEAAHIHAAASGPGARRHLPSMTSEERSNITNAIWLCANHARLIDRDEIRFTGDVLRQIKSEHEKRCARALTQTTSREWIKEELFAVGPDVTFVGSLLGSVGNEWRLSINHFINGDINALMDFGERFDLMPDHYRYVLANTVGDGRVLAKAPEWCRKDGGVIVRCMVLPSEHRIRADQLGSDLMLSEEHDLVVRNGNLALVSGLDALPQKLKTVLSLREGEMAFNPDCGTRLAEFYAMLKGSPWFDDLIKLEIIKQAAIPIRRNGWEQANTPLQCVRRVFGVRALGNAKNGWLDIETDLDIEGIGRWARPTKVYVEPSGRENRSLSMK